MAPLAPLGPCSGRSCKCTRFPELARRLLTGLAACCLCMCEKASVLGMPESTQALQALCKEPAACRCWHKGIPRESNKMGPACVLDGRGFRLCTHANCQTMTFCAVCRYLGHTCTHAHAHAHAHICTHIYTHIYIYTNSHTHMHIHPRAHDRYLVALGSGGIKPCVSSFGGDQASSRV